MSLNISKADALLSWVEEQVDWDLNPDQEECPTCGGEGMIADCFDGFCVDAEDGCEDCARPCPECRNAERQRRRAVRTEVLRALDVDLARAYLRRYRNIAGTTLSDVAILADLHGARAASAAFTEQERADSACWVEGLL